MAQMTMKIDATSALILYLETELVLAQSRVSTITGQLDRLRLMQRENGRKRANEPYDGRR